MKAKQHLENDEELANQQQLQNDNSGISIETQSLPNDEASNQSVVVDLPKGYTSRGLDAGSDSGSHQGNSNQQQGTRMFYCGQPNPQFGGLLPCV